MKYTSENIHDIHTHGIDLNHRELYLIGEESYNSGAGVEETAEPGVEYIMASKFIKNLNILSNISTSDITIHMKTCGGHWQEGIAIYDAIKSCDNNIKIISYTHARSMSSIIFLAADERIMHKHSNYMVHEGTTHTGGTIRQLRTEFEQNEVTMKQMMNIYINHLKNKPYWVNKSEKQIEGWLVKNMRDKEEFYLSAEEAVKFGFADKVIESY